MSLQLGDIAPDFVAKSTAGDISLHSYLGDGWGVFGFAKHVDQINLEGNVTQAGVARLVQNVRVFGVDRHHLVTVGLHVFGREIRWPEPIGRQTHHRDGVR